MAGNKNPWRDIFSPGEWQTLLAQTGRANPRPPGAGAGGAVGGGGWVVATGAQGAVTSPLRALAAISREIRAYDSIDKDDHTRFDQRIAKLKLISVLCGKYLAMLGNTHHLGAKSPGGKQIGDQLDVWVGSLGRRALKKADYLATMKQWHQTAKAKYKDPVAMSNYLMGLHDNLRDGGTMLHATAYATIEKIDPYRRQTFVFPDPGNDRFTPVNEMGTALASYLHGDPASNPPRGTNANASFYEWLEYHPFCIGTPGLTGEARYKDPSRVKYEGHDLGYAFMTRGQMLYTRLQSDPGGRYILNTTDFPASGKGPAGAVAFIWDRDGHLWMHEHGYDGFVHASARSGRKIRCSGMLVVANGLATVITNQSGHYAPTAKNIYYFVFWLQQRKCLAANAAVMIEHDTVLPDDKYEADDFIRWGKGQYGPPVPVVYHE